MFHTGYIQCTGDVFVTAVCALKTPLTDQPNLNKATHFYFYPYIYIVCVNWSLGINTVVLFSAVLYT